MERNPIIISGKSSENEGLDDRGPGRARRRICGTGETPDRGSDDRMSEKFVGEWIKGAKDKSFI